MLKTMLYAPNYARIMLVLCSYYARIMLKIMLYAPNYAHFILILLTFKFNIDKVTVKTA